MTERERMNAGMLYKVDEDLWSQMLAARKLQQEIHTMDRTDITGIINKEKQLFGALGEGSFVTPPFNCDYGSNTYFGNNTCANYGMTILDVGKVTIGDYCQFGPNVLISTAGHPVHPAVRNTGYEYGIPITIGDNVWVGGNVTILPGVTIGSNTVIGAGSVVTKDIPDWCIAVGNPCRVMRRITEADKAYYFRREKVDDFVASLIPEEESNAFPKSPYA